MASILDTIDYLVSSTPSSGGESQKGVQQTQKTEQDMPKWMLFLLSKMTAPGSKPTFFRSYFFLALTGYVSGTNGNVKQFITKIVLNRPNVFKVINWP